MEAAAAGGRRSIFESTCRRRRLLFSLLAFRAFELGRFLKRKKDREHLRHASPRIRTPPVLSLRRRKESRGRPASRTRCNQKPLRGEKPCDEPGNGEENDVRKEKKDLFIVDKMMMIFFLPKNGVGCWGSEKAKKG